MRKVKTYKKPKDKYNLTYGTGKQKVNREKLNDPDKVEYYIYDAIKAVCRSVRIPPTYDLVLKNSALKLSINSNEVPIRLKEFHFGITILLLKVHKLTGNLASENSKKSLR